LFDGAIDNDRLAIHDADPAPSSAEHCLTHAVDDAGTAELAEDAAADGMGGALDQLALSAGIWEPGAAPPTMVKPRRTESGLS